MKSYRTILPFTARLLNSQQKTFIRAASCLVQQHQFQQFHQLGQVQTRSLSANAAEKSKPRVRFIVFVGTFIAKELQYCFPPIFNYRRKIILSKCAFFNIYLPVARFAKLQHSEYEFFYDQILANLP